MTQYHVDLQQFSLEKLKRTLTGGDILPGRKILLEDIDARFSRLQALGIDNLQALIDSLSTPKKLEELSKQSDIPPDYLEMLRRQARFYIPSPVYFKDVPHLDKAVVERLSKAGIKQAKQLYEKVLTSQQRTSLAAELGIPAPALLELASLTDLTRICYTGPIFIRMLYAAGIDSLKKLSQADAGHLFKRLVATNEELKLTKAMFTQKDIAICIAAAKELPHEVEYE